MKTPEPTGGRPGRFDYSVGYRVWRLLSERVGIYGFDGNLFDLLCRILEPWMVIDAEKMKSALKKHIKRHPSQ